MGRPKGRPNKYKTPKQKKEEDPAARETRLQERRAWDRRCRELETPEQRERRLQMKRDSRRRLREIETPQQRAMRLEKGRLWRKKLREQETAEETRERLNRRRKGKIIYEDPDIPGEIMWPMSPQRDRRKSSQKKNTEAIEEGSSSVSQVSREVLIIFFSEFSLWA